MPREWIEKYLYDMLSQLNLNECWQMIKPLLIRGDQSTGVSAELYIDVPRLLLKIHTFIGTDTHHCDIHKIIELLGKTLGAISKEQACLLLQRLMELKTPLPVLTMRTLISCIMIFNDLTDYGMNIMAQFCLKFCIFIFFYFAF